MEETTNQQSVRKAKGNYDVDATVFGVGLEQGRVVFANSDRRQHPGSEDWG